MAETEQRDCRHCGEAFTANLRVRGAWKIYCSRRCNEHANYQRNQERIRARRKPKPAKAGKCAHLALCAFCLAPLARPSQVYCSVECNGRDHRKPDRICTTCGWPWQPTDRPFSQAATECWECRSRDHVPGGRTRSEINEHRRRALIRREEGHCEDCGGHYSEDRLEAHHVVSPSLGGTHELSNLKLLCWDCHRGTGWARNHASLIEAGLAIPPSGTQLALAA